MAKDLGFGFPPQKPGVLGNLVVEKIVEWLERLSFCGHDGHGANLPVALGGEILHDETIVRLKDVLLTTRGAIELFAVRSTGTITSLPPSSLTNRLNGRNGTIDPVHIASVPPLGKTLGNDIAQV